MVVRVNLTNQTGSAIPEAPPSDLPFAALTNLLQVTYTSQKW